MRPSHAPKPVVDKTEQFHARLLWERQQAARRKESARIYRPHEAPSWDVADIDLTPVPKPKQEAEDDDDAEFVPQVVVGGNVTERSEIVPKSPELKEVAVDISNLEVPTLEEEEPVEDSQISRRDFLRQTILAKQRARDQPEVSNEASSNSISEDRGNGGSADDGPSESQSEEEVESYKQARPKVAFVRKELRTTFADREKRELAAELEEELQAAREAERKEESKQIALEFVKKEEEAERRGAEDSTRLPDDTDKPEDEEEDLLHWQVRELRRLKRDQEERKQEEVAAAEIERRKKMTPEEREAERRIISERRAAEKAAKELSDAETNQEQSAKRHLMQRYYHKGAFYQSDEFNKDRLFDRDFQQPTGEDAIVDKSLLPKAMQVRGFGLKNRTKYTTLLDQDTTQKRENLWVQTQKVNSNLVPKLGGVVDLELKKASTKRKPSS